VPIAKKSDVPEMKKASVKLAFHLIPVPVKRISYWNFDQPQRSRSAGAGEFLREHADIGRYAAFFRAQKIQSAGDGFPPGGGQFLRCFDAWNKGKSEENQGVFHGGNLFFKRAFNESISGERRFPSGRAGAEMRTAEGNFEESFDGWLDAPNRTLAAAPTVVFSLTASSVIKYCASLRPAVLTITSGGPYAKIFFYEGERPSIP
jgi:hypothetical protein